MAGSIFCDGTDDRVTYADSVDRNPLEITDYLIQAWVRPLTVGTGHNNGRIFVRGPVGSTSNDHMQLMIGNGDGGTRNGNFTLRQARSSTFAIAVCQTGTVPDNTWSLIGGHYRPTQAIQLYVNGSPVTSAMSQTGNGVTQTRPSDPIGLGSNGGTQRPFGGYLGGQGIWSTEGLTDAQVDAIALAMWNSGSGSNITIPSQTELVEFLRLAESGGTVGEKGVLLDPMALDGAAYTTAQEPPVTYAALAGGDVTPPVIDVTAVSVTKISQVIGKDSADVDFETDEEFVEYEIRLVASASDTRAMGTQIETAVVSARTQHAVTITDDELIAATGAEGSNLLKVFVKDAAENWSA